MGHDIEIRNDGKKGNIVLTTYISFNWSKYSDYFHIREINGQPGHKIKPFLENVLYELKKNGFEPNFDVRVDRWGNAKPEFFDYIKDKYPKELEELEKKCRFGFEIGNIAWEVDEFEKDQQSMFAFIVQQFLEIAKEHPNGYWYSDQCWGKGSLGKSNCEEESEESEQSEESDSDDESEEEKPPGSLVPIEKIQNILPFGIYGVRYGNGFHYKLHHPERGTMAINTFADAMEFHRLAKENENEEHADFWYKVAFMLPAKISFNK